MARRRKDEWSARGRLRNGGREQRRVGLLTQEMRERSQVASSLVLQRRREKVQARVAKAKAKRVARKAPTALDKAIEEKMRPRATAEAARRQTLAMQERWERKGAATAFRRQKKLLIGADELKRQEKAKQDRVEAIRKENAAKRRYAERVALGKSTASGRLLLEEKRGEERRKTEAARPLPRPKPEKPERPKDYTRSLITSLTSRINVLQRSLANMRASGESKAAIGQTRDKIARLEDQLRQITGKAKAKRKEPIL